MLDHKVLQADALVSKAVDLSGQTTFAKRFQKTKDGTKLTMQVVVDITAKASPVISAMVGLAASIRKIVAHHQKEKKDGKKDRKEE